MTETDAAIPATKSGFVALLGAPNAGKSTLINRLVGGKVSIVSRKVQTTRALIRGVTIENETQIIFVDTPGIFAPRRRLDRAMVASAWGGAGDADQLALLIDTKRGLTDDVIEIITALKERKQPKILLLNKIDLIDRTALLDMTQKIDEIMAFDHVFMISAEKGDGCADFMTHIASSLPPGPWLYPEDQMSDLPMRQLAAEITREKLFERLHQELPYASTVETEAWQDMKNGDVRIEQTVYVQRDSQKKIVLGKGGQTIKAISSTARHEIAEIVDKKVHLFLFVKVREKWVDDPERYRQMGLDFTA